MVGGAGPVQSRGPAQAVRPALRLPTHRRPQRGARHAQPGRGPGNGGDLQRGSNVGRGQVAAADFFIIPDIANSNRNSGGNNVGAALGGFLPGGFGALAGGLRIKKSEAHTLITLEDARTTEQVYVAEGTAQKSDMSFGGGGGLGSWSGFGALAGSGYSDTDIGKVISAAYFNAFTDLIHYMQAQSPGAQAASARPPRSTPPARSRPAPRRRPPRASCTA